MRDRPWRLFERKSRWRRRLAVRGEHYDDSRWRLRNRYATKEAAERVRDTLLGRMGPMKTLQFRIMHDDEGRP